MVPPAFCRRGNRGGVGESRPLLPDDRRAEEKGIANHTQGSHPGKVGGWCPPGISVSDDTVYRALKELGFSHVSARPKAYKQDPETVEAFKKLFRPRGGGPREACARHSDRGVVPGRDGVGQKNKLTYRWARKGSRPRATHDQRTQSTY